MLLQYIMARQVLWLPFSERGRPTTITGRILLYGKSWTGQGMGLFSGLWRICKPIHPEPEGPECSIPEWPSIQHLELACHSSWKQEILRCRRTPAWSKEIYPGEFLARLQVLWHHQGIPGRWFLFLLCKGFHQQHTVSRRSQASHDARKAGWAGSFEKRTRLQGPHKG